MQLRTYIRSALVLAIAGTSSAFAQQSELDRQRKQFESRQRTQRGDQSPESVAGRVVLTKKVGIRNQPFEHMVVLLKDKQGKKAYADLGPVKQLAKFKIKRGDQLQATGRIVQMGDYQVLMADKIRKDDRIAQVDRRRPKGQQQRRVGFRGDRPDRQREKVRDTRARGQIVRTKKVGLRGQPLEHLVVLLKRDRTDKVWAVDLGPVKNLKNAKISTGDQVAVQGEVVNVGDRQVLMARKLEKDGREVNIQRQRRTRRTDRQGPRSDSRSQRRDDRRFRD